MTAQIPDCVIYQNEKYDTTGINGNEPVDPHKLGVTRFIGSTACYRGYYYTCTVADSRLWLTQLAVGRDETMPLQGIAPVDTEFGEAHYNGLRLEIPFTGGILAGRGFINLVGVLTGYPRPHSFETVLEFHFEQGKLIAVDDHSARMAELRRQINDNELAWLIEHGDEIKAVEQAKQELDTLKKKLPPPGEWVSNDPSNADLFLEEPDTVQALRAQIAAIRNHNDELNTALEAQKHIHRQRRRERIRDAFSPGYKL